MTIDNTPIVNSYTGTGGANTYPFSFDVFNEGDIAVVVTSPANVIYTLILDTDFTVSGLNPSGGPATSGSIVLVNSSQAWLTGAFLTSLWTIKVTRSVSIVQSSSIRNQGDFYQEFIENALDYITMICQQLQQEITSPVIPTSVASVNGDITIVPAGSGIIFTDQATGKTYRVFLQNGAIALQELT